MPGYRLYFLDHANHISRALELDCEDDEGAMAMMRQHANGEIIELWDRARRIIRYEPPKDYPQEQATPQPGGPEA